MKRVLWTRDQLILAINLYCKTPFGRIHKENPDIIKLSKLINRTPSALAWKMANFAHLDPSLSRKGASNVAKQDIEIWNEFFNNWEELGFESEKLLNSFFTDKKYDSEDLKNIPEGKDKERLVRTRVNQAFFRQTVLASYNFKCCITNIAIPDLLIGSHIVPWAKDNKNRLNPRNGLCLNALHDKAFDCGIISISEGFKIIVSPKFKKLYNGDAEQKFILNYEDTPLNKPNRFIPNETFLSYHRNNIFQS
ncbi:MAG: restriction endonuclease [Lentisphaerae bacterium GWF2_45_14]|nr:MAG: restriction endonuclease [Lentisphaerae bacterium GWF2_45_14]